MKIYDTEGIRAWDAYTIEHEPIRSVDLMNRAAAAFTHWFTGIYRDTNRPVYIFVGTGNNGGDGLAVARNLHYQFYEVNVLICDFGAKHSPDFDAQIKTLPPRDSLSVQVLSQAHNMPAIPNKAVVIDALFGSGLTRPPAGEWEAAINCLNALPNERVSIDLPSGMYADKHTDGPCIRAARTYSFETPKRAFFFRENIGKTGEWAFGSIGLHPEFPATRDTPFFFFTREMAQRMLRSRNKFDHKGNFGHALLLAGSYGKMGAAVLAANAAIRAGAGLLTVHTARCGNIVLQTAVPEAMFSADRRGKYWSSLPDLGPYKAIGVGPGIGTEPATAAVLEQLLEKAGRPLVLDADALNLLADHPEWWRTMPRNSILTPHPKEFERLFGPTPHEFAANDLLREKAQEHGVFIVLKGAYTAVAGPDGSCSFNSTGNPGMATGGSGDVLTGMITALLAQGYAPAEAARLGVFLHGRTGDLAAAEAGGHGLKAGDFASFFGKAWFGH